MAEIPAVPRGIAKNQLSQKFRDTGQVSNFSFNFFYNQMIISELSPYNMFKQHKMISCNFSSYWAGWNQKSFLAAEQLSLIMICCFLLCFLKIMKICSLFGRMTAKKTFSSFLQNTANSKIERKYCKRYFFKTRPIVKLREAFKFGRFNVICHSEFIGTMKKNQKSDICYK